MEQPAGQNFDNSQSINAQPLKPEEQQLISELTELSNSHGENFPAICNFLRKEVDKITKGNRSEKPEYLDLESGKPLRMTYKINVPMDKYPNFNYVGRLLGPKGATLKSMQEISGCRMAVLGRGSMRDKNKEEECRQEGGKYEHLNEPLHVWVQAFGTPENAFYKLYIATKEVKKYLQADYNDEIFNEQMAMLGQDGVLQQRGAPMMRGGPRGRSRGAPTRGSFRGGMPGRGGATGGPPSAAPAPVFSPRGGRGNLRSRGMGRSHPAGMSRGSLHGAPPAGRGMSRAPSSRGDYQDAMYEDVYEPAPAGYDRYSGPSAQVKYENGSNDMGMLGSSSYYKDYSGGQTEYQPLYEGDVGGMRRAPKRPAYAIETDEEAMIAPPRQRQYMPQY